MLTRFGALVLERRESSRSPPDHLLYQMLKIVPVWGGGSDFRVDGSTWTRAGRRFLRRTVLVFLAGADEGVSVVRSVEEGVRGAAVVMERSEVSLVGSSAVRVGGVEAEGRSAAPRTSETSAMAMLEFLLEGL